MPKDTKTLGNNKARACESLGFVHKKRLCQRFDTTSLKLLVKVLFAIIIFHYYRVINRAHSFLAELQSGYRNYHLKISVRMLPGSYFFPKA